MNDPNGDNVKANMKTIYRISVYHANGGRRAVIEELLNGRWPKVVADFVCIDSDECDWLERHGKHPRYAYRYMTTTDDGEITMHAPGSYPIIGTCPSLGIDSDGVPF